MGTFLITRFKSTTVAVPRNQMDMCYLKGGGRYTGDLQPPRLHLFEANTSVFLG